MDSERKMSIMDINDLENKKVLVRVDFNVPIKDGVVKDDTRIRAALPTINYLIQKNCKIILMSHLGRPKLPDIEKKYSLEPVAEHLKNLVDTDVFFSPELVCEETRALISKLKPKQILLLENTRYNPGETKNDPELGKELASLADYFVNDAFGTLHRAHASTVGVAIHLTAVAGLLVKKEIDALDSFLKNPEKPVLAIFGGAKVSDKIKIINRFIGFADYIAIGGGMAFTFLKSKGNPIGKSLVEDSMLNEVENALQTAKSKNTEIHVPKDFKIGHDLDTPFLENNMPKVVNADSIPNDAMGLDIGPQTISDFNDLIDKAHSIFWNGPMGVFENPLYKEGTLSIAEKLLQKKTKTIIGGGDSVYALNMTLKEKGLSLPPEIHVSTGGGATLEYMAGNVLPGLEALDNLA